MPDGLVRIKYNKGRTVNLGNFQSWRVDIGIELDSTVDDIPAAYKRAEEWVNRKLQEEIKKVNG